MPGSNWLVSRTGPRRCSAGSCPPRRPVPPGRGSMPSPGPCRMAGRPVVLTCCGRRCSSGWSSACRPPIHRPRPASQHRTIRRGRAPPGVRATWWGRATRGRAPPRGQMAWWGRAIRWGRAPPRGRTTRRSRSAQNREAVRLVVLGGAVLGGMAVRLVVLGGVAARPAVPDAEAVWLAVLGGAVLLLAAPALTVLPLEARSRTVARETRCSPRGPGCRPRARCPVPRRTPPARTCPAGTGALVTG